MLTSIQTSRLPPSITNTQRASTQQKVRVFAIASDQIGGQASSTKITSSHGKRNLSWTSGMTRRISANLLSSKCPSKPRHSKSNKRIVRVTPKAS